MSTASGRPRPYNTTENVEIFPTVPGRGRDPPHSRHWTGPRESVGSPSFPSDNTRVRPLLCLFIARSPYRLVHARHHAARDDLRAHALHSSHSASSSGWSPSSPPPTSLATDGEIGRVVPSPRSPPTHIATRLCWSPPLSPMWVDGVAPSALPKVFFSY